MNRREELLKVLNNIDEDKRTIVINLVDDVLYLETELEKLRKLPMIRTNPANPEQQKTTPAAKLYKEMLQQYNSCIKILCSACDKLDDKEESPLRAYLKRFEK